MNDSPAGYSIAIELDGGRRCSGCDAATGYYEMDFSAHSPPPAPES